MKLIEIKITTEQLNMLIEALCELYNKYEGINSMLFKPDDIMLCDYKLRNIDMLSQYLRCRNDSN